jgi:hypothetical protein
MPARRYPFERLARIGTGPPRFVGDKYAWHKPRFTVLRSSANLRHGTYFRLRRVLSSY